MGGEIGSAILIESISFEPVDPTSSVFFNEFTIYLGPCSSDELGTDFEANYLPGIKTEVFNRTDWTLDASPGWFTIEFDTPYWYSGSGNLIIDFEWPDGEHEIYNFNWDTGSNRALYADYGEPTGTNMTDIPHMLLNGTLALDQNTFGAIKALFAE